MFARLCYTRRRPVSVAREDHPMLRIIGAVVAGIVVTFALVIVGTAAAVALLLPGALQGQATQLTPTYLVANLAISVLAAVGGGLVAALIARAAATTAVRALALLLLLLSLASVLISGV